MEHFSKASVVVVTFVSMLGLLGPATALAATTPSLGFSATYAILGSTYTNTAAGTTITGDVGYTTGPAVAPTVTGVVHIADSSYTQAGTDQGVALSALNAQPCTFNYGSATDLALLSQPLAPGVYCITGAASIGTGGITLNGAGTYIFRITGAFTTVANSVVTLTGGASACDVFWTPAAATTLGANSTFVGTNIDTSGITIGANTTWTGRSLAFGGTVTTDADTISVPVCLAPTPTPTPTPVMTPTPTPIPSATPTPTPVPGLPNTGTGPDTSSTSRSAVVLMGVVGVLGSFTLARRRHVLQ